MPDDTGGNTVSRLLLGQHLRQLREERGIHAEDAAIEVGVARATLWRMEKGDARCRYKPGDVEMLGRLYGADDKTTELLAELAKGTRARSWTAAYRDLVSESFETFVDLEGYACRIRCYVSTLVPDLLQVEDYTRAVLAASRNLSSIDVRKHTRIRLRRQLVMNRQPRTTQFDFILDEAVLRRPIGEPGVMARQLQKIAERAGLPNVSVRAVPLRAGMHPGLEAGPFAILEFPPDRQFGSLPSVVHLHRNGEHTLLEKLRDVEAYEQRWEDILALALDEPASLELITRHGSEHG